MKSFFSKFGRPFFAAVLALSMIFGASVPALATIEDLDGNRDGDLNYVSIGDSMTNGYGFDGYDQGNVDFFESDNVYGKDVYPNLFEAYLEGLGYNVNHTELAASALRAEDLNYLLGGREKPTDGWFDNINHYTMCDDDAKLSEFYTNAVTNADIITLCIGNASFGAFFIDYLTSLLAVMDNTLDENEIVDLEMAIADLDEETKKTVLELYEKLLAELMAYVPAEITEQYKLTFICDVIAYISVGFIINYKQVIERIVELNPDVEIILIGIMNTTYGMTFTVDGMDPIPFGDIMDEVFGVMNAYIAALPAVLQESGEYSEAEFYYTEQLNPKFIVQEFDDIYENGWTNHNGLSGTTIRERNITAFNYSLRKVISSAFGRDLVNISLTDVQNYEADPGGYAVSNPSNAVSVAVYLALEEAVAKSVDTLEIPLSGLAKIADGLAESFVGFSFEIDAADPASVDRARAKLAEYLINNPERLGMCKIYALISIGNGMSVHPTPEAHKELAELIIKAYEEGHTVQDATLDNLLSYADKVWEVTKLAYREAYKKALESGHIDTAVSAIRTANEEIDRAYAMIDSLDISDELKAELREEIDLAKIILKDIEDMLVNGEVDQLDSEALEALYDLLDKLGAALFNVADIAKIAGVDTYIFLAEKWETVWRPAIETAVNEIADAARAFIEEKLNAAYAMLADAIAELEAQLAMLSDAACAEIKALIAELKAIADKIGTDIDGALDSALDKLNATVGKINAFIERIKSLNEKLAAAAEKLAELNEQLRAAFAKLESLNELIAEKLYELETLHTKLLEKYSQLKDAASDAKQEIEAAIAKLEAAIETVKAEIESIKQIIENVKAEIKDIKAKISALTAEIEALRANIDSLVSSLKQGVEEVRSDIDSVLAKISEAYENLSSFANGLWDVAEDVKEKLESVKNTIAELKAGIVADIKAAIDTAKAVIDGIERTVEIVKNSAKYIKNTLLNVKDAIESFKTTILELKAKLEAFKQGLITDIEGLIKDITAAIALLKSTASNVKDVLCDLSDAVNELCSYLAKLDIDPEAVADAVEGLIDAVEDVRKSASLLKLVIEMMIDGTTYGYYTVEDDSFYIALGDIVSEYNETYVELLADTLGIDFENLSDIGGIAAALELISEDPEFFAEADLITLNFSNAGVSAFMFEQMNSMISGKKAEEMDWVELLGETNAYRAESVFDDMHAMLIEEGLGIEFMGVNLADLLALGVESYAFAYASGILTYPELTKLISKVAPNALIVAIGTYNDLENVVLEMEGMNIDIGSYIEYTVDAANLETLLCAMLADANIVYVDAPDVETVFESDVAAGEYENVTLMTYFNVILNGDLAPSEAGHAYIVEQILNTVEVHRHEFDSCTDTDCDCGHVREPAEHKFGDWTTVKEPTTAEKGQKERVCTVCGHKETAEIDKLPEDTTPGDETTTAPEDEVTTPDDDDTSPDETTPDETPVDTTPVDTPDDTADRGGDDNLTHKGLPTGAVIGISLAAVSVVAAGAFCLYLFVFKKKIG